MKIIHWNCNGAFRTKSSQILDHKPDILVIAECENEHKLEFGKLIPKPKDYRWIGDSPNKGMGVFSYSDYELEVFTEYDRNHRYILPLKVSNQKESFTFFAVWAMKNKVSSRTSYIGQVWFALNKYANLLNEKTILIGDFNSNQIWDKLHAPGNHTALVNRLSENNIKSLYHTKYQENHGYETIPTFFMQKNKEKGYHIDYCFASEEIIKKGFDIEIGNYDSWYTVSDHVPLIVSFGSQIF